MYAEMCSFPGTGRRRVEQDIAAGGECLYEEKLVMLLMRRLHYPENTIRFGRRCGDCAVRVEGAGGVNRGLTSSDLVF